VVGNKDEGGRCARPGKVLEEPEEVLPSHGVEAGARLTTPQGV
jgi:hypothetical protein